jgi:hypothetical protein
MPPRRSSAYRAFLPAIAALLAGICGAAAAPAASEPIASVPAAEVRIPAGASPDSLWSHWGWLPAPGQPGATARLMPPSRPLWAAALEYPYQVVTYPVHLLAEGVTAGIVTTYRWHVVATLQRLARLQGPFVTLITPSITAGGLLGYGGGLTIRRLASGAAGDRFKLRWQSTSTGSHKLTLGMLLQRPALQAAIGYRVRPNARYLGVGPGSMRSDESYFRQNVAWAGLEWRRPVSASSDLILGTLFSALDNGAPPDRFGTALAERFAGELPAGYGHASVGATLSCGLMHDTTGLTGRPTGGGLQRVRVSYFARTGGSGADFWSYRLEAQQFIHLYHLDRVLALRGLIGWLDPAGPAPIHFQRLLTNDDPDLLRGYNDFRWRDRGLAILTAEYRWPIWFSAVPRGTGLDFYLLTDVGQVFGDLREISGRSLTWSYGAGLRLVGGQGDFVARLEIAFSEEETVLRLRADQIFQFSKGGLYHGRDPVPAR